MSDKSADVVPVVEVEIVSSPADVGPVARVTLTPNASPCAGTHWWYWARPYTLRCKRCGAVKHADR